jgi:hypothetical protein
METNEIIKEAKRLISCGVITHAEIAEVIADMGQAKVKAFRTVFNKTVHEYVKCNWKP